jgi:ribosome modulation factor
MTTDMNLDLDVEFGGVSIGDATARLGVRIERGVLDLELADECFGGKQMQCKVTLEKRDDAGQQRLPGMEDAVPLTIESSPTCKQFSTNAKRFSAGLTFALSAIDVAELSQFAKRKGRLIISGVDALDDDDPDEDEDYEVDDHEDVGPRVVKKRPTQPLPAGVDTGAAMPLSALIRHGMTAKKLEVIEAACGGSTIGHFEQWMASNEWWHRDLHGFGETWVTKLQDALLEFRLANPVPAEAGPDLAADAYTRGCEDCVAGRTENPYVAQDLRDAWVRGWNATDEESTDEADGSEVDDAATGTVFDAAVSGVAD